MVQCLATVCHAGIQALLLWLVLAGTLPELGPLIQPDDFLEGLRTATDDTCDGMPYQAWNQQNGQRRATDAPSGKSAEEHI